MIWGYHYFWKHPHVRIFNRPLVHPASPVTMGTCLGGPRQRNARERGAKKERVEANTHVETHVMLKKQGDFDHFLSAILGSRFL